MYICPKCKAEYKSKIDGCCPACKFGIVVTEECYRMGEEHTRKFKEKQEIIEEFMDYIFGRTANFDCNKALDVYSVSVDGQEDAAGFMICSNDFIEHTKELQKQRDAEEIQKWADDLRKRNANQEYIIPQLSFDDLKINEKLLIDLPMADVGRPNYNYRYGEMNERFLHTFIDDCFVP